MPRPPESLPADRREERARRRSRRMAALALATALLAFSALFRAAPPPPAAPPFRPPAPLAVATAADFDASSPAADPRALLSPAIYALPTRIGFTHRLATAVPSADAAAPAPGAAEARLPPAPPAEDAAAPASAAPSARGGLPFRSPLPAPAPAASALPAPEAISLPEAWRGKISFPAGALALLAPPEGGTQARSLPAADFRLVFDAEGGLLGAIALPSAPPAGAAALAPALGGTKLLDADAPRAGVVRFRLPSPAAAPPPAAAARPVP